MIFNSAKYHCQMNASPSLVHVRLCIVKSSYLDTDLFRAHTFPLFKSVFNKPRCHVAALSRRAVTKRLFEASFQMLSSPRAKDSSPVFALRLMCLIADGQYTLRTSKWHETYPAELVVASSTLSSRQSPLIFTHYRPLLTRHMVAPMILLNPHSTVLIRTLLGRTRNLLCGCFLFFSPFIVPLIILLTRFSLVECLVVRRAEFQAASATSKDVIAIVDLT